jgi:hypothetical protein
VQQEVRTLEERFEDHVGRRGSWAHEE